MVALRYLFFNTLLVVGDCFAAIPAARTPTTAVGWLRAGVGTPTTAKVGNQTQAVELAAAVRKARLQCCLRFITPRYNRGRTEEASSDPVIFTFLF